MSVNKVILVGNVGKDPETRYLDDSTVISKFPLATSETYKNRSGERVSTTEWHNIVTCCMECNRHKGGKTPREAGMKLLRKPTKPEWLPILRITINIKQAPESWFDYLYWNVDLES